MTTGIGTPLTNSAKRVMLLGGGELGKEVVLELQRFGVEVIPTEIAIGLDKRCLFISIRAPGQRRAGNGRSVGLELEAPVGRHFQQKRRFGQPGGRRIYLR